MINLIEIFAPYIPFMVTLFSIVINVWLIIKGISWTNLLIFNVILSVVTNLVAISIPSLDGLIQYDLLSLVLTSIIDILKDLINGLFDFDFDFIPDWLENIF